MELFRPFLGVPGRRLPLPARHRRVLVVGKRLAARLQSRLSRLDVSEDVLVDRSRAASLHA